MTGLGSESERRLALRTLSLAAERAGDFARAARYEMSASKGGAGAADRLASQRRIESLDKAAHLRALNERRMPAFGAEIAQGQLVRPRLKALPPGVTAPAAGGKGQ